MKKILALILVIGCILAFASCQFITPPTTDGNVDNEGNKQTVANIQQIVDDSAPKSADISVVFDTAIGKLNGSYDVTYNDDGSATVEYSYEMFNTFDENAQQDGPKSVKSGVVTVNADGTVDGDVEGAASVEGVSFDIDLDEKLLKSAKVSASVLTATVEADNTYDVLGVDIYSDVSLTISTGNGRVTSIVISYEAESGPVVITTVYHY